MSFEKDEPDIKEFSTFRNFLSCSNVQQIEYEYRCDYVRNTTECQQRQFFFNYIEIMYCLMGPNTDTQMYGCLMLFVCLCLFLFIVLGTTADKFFCPALEMLSKVMGLSEHLAGITLLAFGNGSPDLFTSLASFRSVTVTLYSNLVSAAIYVTAFVGGIICIIRPFYINGSNLLRDVSFFILATLYIDYAVDSDGHVTRLEAISFISIYFIYLVVIVTDQYLLKRSVSKMEQQMLKGRMTVHEYENYTSLREEANIDIVAQQSGVSVNIESLRKSFYGRNAGPNSKLLQQLRKSLKPIKKNEWSLGRSRWWKRILICFKAPVTFLLTFFIPTVHFELERHGWSKLLNCVQLIILPFITFLLIFQFKTWLGLPLCIYTLVVTTPLAILIFFFTRTDTPPSFHVLFAFLSAYGSIFVIYSCASEIIQVLYVLGLVMDCSSSFLGCTLLAWGNGIGDLVSTITLALHGYQKMAFAACYGGPFFNTLLGLGFVLLIQTFQREEGQVNLPLGPLGANSFIFMIIILFGTLMWSTTTNFYARRSIGIFNILIYALFFLYTVLAELEVIQTYAEMDKYGFDDS